MDKKELIEQAKALIKHIRDNPAAIEELSKAQSGAAALKAAMKKGDRPMVASIKPEGERGAKQTTHDGPTGGNESSKSTKKDEIKPDAKLPKLSDKQRAGPSSQSGAMGKDEPQEIKPEGERGAKQTTHDGPTGGNESAQSMRKMIKDELKSDWKPKWAKEKKCE